MTFGISNSITEKAYALVTHDLTYNRQVGGASATFTGSITIDETSVTYGEFVTNNLDLPTWVQSLSLTYNSGLVGAANQTFTASDFRN